LTKVESKALTALLLLLSLSFMAAGFNHFYKPQLYLQIMPAYLPIPLMLIYISGFFEMLGGLGILLKRTRYWAGVGLIALSIAVFPANIQMALEAEFYTEIAAAWVWYARLPLQLIIIYWIHYTCLRVPK